MKQIIGNRYVEMFEFASSQEATFFLHNQGNTRVIDFDETFGDNHLCYVCHHSLTNEKQFVLSFSSDESSNNLNLLFWEKHDLIVLDTGKFIYLLNNKLTVVESFEITTSLIGLYLTDKDSLLLLEEAYIRLINSEGIILRDELFDLIQDFSIEEDKLIIHTSEERKVFELT